MKYREITIDLNKNGREEFKENDKLLSIEILIDGKKYSISERSGNMHISVDDGIVVYPKANNCFEINQRR